LKLNIKNNLFEQLSISFLALAVDLLWRATFGLKPTLMYYFLMLKDRDSELRKNGLKIVHSDVHFTQFANDLSSKISSEHIAKGISKMDSPGSVNNYFVDIIDDLDEETKIEILRFALANRNIDIASSYLRFIPTLSTVKVLLNKATKEAPVGPQRWHRDWFGYKGLNIFIALTDISERQGMYSAIGLNAISCREEILLNNNDPDIEPYDRGRVSDVEMEKYVKSDDVQRLIGPPGTTAIVDNNWVYHKGGHVKEGYRLMVEISYHTTVKPRQSQQQNILDTLGLAQNSSVNNLLDTPVRRYMVKKRANKTALGWIFHFLARRFTYPKAKRG